MLLHRIPVIVSALAVLLGFVWAPYQHVHAFEGVQHAHIAPHADAHHHDTSAPQPEDHEHPSNSTFSVDSFLCTAVAGVATLMPSEAPETPLIEPPLSTMADPGPSRPQSHDPPSPDRIGSRAPPAIPTF
jgi:hypothetical protein